MVGLVAAIGWQPNQPQNKLVFKCYHSNEFSTTVKFLSSIEATWRANRAQGGASITASDEKVNGSCMCGAVRYEAIGKPVNVANCHWTIEV
jgi:hypothetical protein